MLHGNSIKILTGAFLSSLASRFFTIKPPSQGNSHPELAATVAER
jgi:hypothetical protein